MVCLTNLVVQPGHTAEAFKWSSSIELATLGTSQNPKPLLVIDLAGEVTSEPFTSPLGRLLAATTFGDPRIIELSRRRFDVVCRQHGASELVKRHVPKRGKSLPHAGQSDNVVFYFCTPDARVLHLATGFLRADELLNAATLAERLLRETQLECESIRQMQAVRNWHVLSAGSKYLLAFQSHCATKREKPTTIGAWNAQYVSHVVAAAAEVHVEELRVRFANHWPRGVLKQTIPRLGQHGELRTSFAHLVLSEVPLVPLDVIDRTCFEVVTGQPYLSITARRKTLYSWFLTSRRLRKPIMFVVDDRPFKAPFVNELSELLIWQPKSADVRQRLADFAAAQVTPGELAGLVQDVGLSPVTLSRKSRNWLLFDRQGDYVDVVFQEHGPRLLEAMDLASE